MTFSGLFCFSLYQLLCFVKPEGIALTSSEGQSTWTPWRVPGGSKTAWHSRCWTCHIPARACATWLCGVLQGLPWVRCFLPRFGVCSPLQPGGRCLLKSLTCLLCTCSCWYDAVSPKQSFLKHTRCPGWQSIFLLDKGSTVPSVSFQIFSQCFFRG